MAKPFEINKRVRVDGKPDQAGKVVGYGTYIREDETSLIYLVELDKGFYAQDERPIFVSTLAVHSENVYEDVDNGR